jgi:hypothetical protein
LRWHDQSPAETGLTSGQIKEYGKNYMTVTPPRPKQSEGVSDQAVFDRICDTLTTSGLVHCQCDGITFFAYGDLMKAVDLLAVKRLIDQTDAEVLQDVLKKERQNPTRPPLLIGRLPDDLVA